MPRIELIPEVLYGPLDPIHWEIDNGPLKAILRRQNLINLALDNVIEQMRDAIGTQGSLANRLNQSIAADGSLLTDAVNEANHSIEAHEDTDDYVRMTRLQSDKLDEIADEAKNIGFEFYTDVDDDDVFVEFSDGVVKIKPSSTVVPRFESPNILKFDLSYPESSAHQHYFGIIPVDADTIDPDYINFKVANTEDPTVFIENTLRVYVNGVRIFEDAEVYVPGPAVENAWTLLKFTSDAENGSFELSAPLSEDDIIRIDFDISLT
jgi:hypothetical protein